SVSPFTENAWNYLWLRKNSGVLSIFATPAGSDLPKDVLIRDGGSRPAGKFAYLAAIKIGAVDVMASEANATPFQKFGSRYIMNDNLTPFGGSVATPEEIDDIADYYPPTAALSYA